MLETLTDADLVEVEVHAPGMVTTSDHPDPWHASPTDCVEARRILRERGYR